MSGPEPDRPAARHGAEADVTDHLREIASMLASMGFHAAAANVRRAIAEIERLRAFREDASRSDGAPGVRAGDADPTKPR